jgi:tetratricopeptide (TPR) repeat protein
VVAIGKDIVQNVAIHITQLGTMQVVVLAAVLSAVIIATVLSSGFFAERLSPPTPVVMNAPSAPKPTEPPSPVAMTELFNVAVADFGQVDDLTTGAARESEDGQWLADKAFELMVLRVPEIPQLSGDVELQHEYISFIPGDTPETRQEAAAEQAQEINADVLIYGYLVVGQLPVTFVPEFYVSPRLTGAEELMGANAFGSEMLVRLPIENTDNKAKLKADLIPRFEALTEFMFGLALFKADEPDLALQQLELARSVPEWGEEEEGKEILYLLIGSTLNKRALEGEEVEGFTCPIEGHEESDDWACARAAYEKALALNPKYGRAHIGLGKLWFDQAKQTRGGKTFYVCSAYERAVEAYRRALDPTMEATTTAYVDVRTYFNIGSAYATAYRNRCGEQFYPLAAENLTWAVAAYEENPDVRLLREAGAKAYYQLGLIHVTAEKYTAAVDALTQAVSVAEPDDVYEEGWQVVRWYAYNQLGHAYSELAEAGDDARWQDAIDAYSKAVAGYDEEAFASTAYHGVGVAYARAGQHAEALEPLENSIAIAEGWAASEPEAWQSLRWASYLELGSALAGLAEAGDTARWSEALEAYDRITSQFESGAQDVDGAIAAEAYYRAGLAHEGLGDVAQARASYEEVAATEGAAPGTVDRAQERLQAIGGP